MLINGMENSPLNREKFIYIYINVRILNFKFLEIRLNVILYSSHNNFNINYIEIKTF